MTEPEIDWEAVLRAAAELQKLVPGAVLVGGTAAALHARHRLSLDADHVIADLRQRFAELLQMLEARSDWVTNRVQPPKLILGDFMGVETGLRQLVRARPLETTTVVCPAGPVVVPTAAEMLRIKGWLVIQRNATRDYIDVAALGDALGPVACKEAMRSFDSCYRDVYRQESGRETSPLLQLARQLAEPRPKDLAETDVPHYKGIVQAWAAWSVIVDRCQALAVRIAEAGTGR